MATIGNAPVFPTESVLPGNLQVTGNATISGSSATVNGDEVRTVGTSGAILQVVQATTNTTVANTTATYVDSGLSASITPSSSSNKVLVLVSQHCVHGRSVDGQGGGIQLLRGSTVIWEPVNNGNGASTGPFLFYLSDVRDLYYFTPLNYLDSPATTSSVTYKTQGRVYETGSNGSFTMQPGPGQGTADPTTSTMILMEVVA